MERVIARLEKEYKKHKERGDVDAKVNDLDSQVHTFQYIRKMFDPASNDDSPCPLQGDAHHCQD